MGVNVRLALTTAPDQAAAESIAKAVVERKLAACVNIIPGIRSVYHWEGKLCDEKELLLIIKTSSDTLAALAVAMKELHPYDTPEFVVIEPSFVSKRYAEWVRDQTENR